MQPSVALYFTDERPTRSAVLFLLRSVEIDIPAGAADYVVEKSYELPVNVEIPALLPHLHYLGKDVHAWADLPDGSRRELLRIKEWDFNWQGDYRYVEPERLPKKSVIRMRYTFDNTAGNPRNPNRPPKRVTYGLQSSDEMSELWIRLIPQNPADDAALRADIRQKVSLPDAISFANVMLRRDPKDAQTRVDLGTALAASGRLEEAEVELKRSIEDDPNQARAHHVLGQIAMRQEDTVKANAALQRAVQLEPRNAAMRSELGWVMFASGDVKAGTAELERAVVLDSDDMVARRNLQRARSASGGR